RHLGAGVVRARGRLRPGLTALDRHARRGRLGPQRPEGVVHPRLVRRQGLRTVPHRPGRAASQGPDLLHVRPPGRRRDRATDRPARRTARLRRTVPRGRLRPRRPREPGRIRGNRRGRQGLAGGHVHRQQRARALAALPRPLPRHDGPAARDVATQRARPRRAEPGRTGRPRGGRLDRLPRLRAQHLGHGHQAHRRRGPGLRIVPQQGVLVRLGHRHPRDRTGCPGHLGRTRRREVDGRLLVRPRRAHLRGHQRGPEEHHRRATPRPAARLTGDIMEFALDPEITDFATSVDSLLASSDMPSVIRAWNDGDTDPGTRVWGRVAETGATALLIGEDSGGAGATAGEAMVALEVLGRHAVPGPVVESVMVAPRIAGALGGDSDLGDVAGEIAGGALATVAVPGVSPFAPDPHVASHTWVADDDSVFLGTAGEHRRSVDRARTVTRPEPGARIAAASTTDLVNHGPLGTAAQLQGLGRAMLDMTVDYAKQRKQYGRFIGEYQALKHQLADVAIALEMSRPLLWAGALSLAENPDDPAASV